MNRAQPDCESHEILISTWMDEGLERGEQRELLDHMVRCAHCRSFYADARALGGLAAVAVAGSGAEEPPLELWERIQSRVEGPETSAESRPVWAWRAAAALLLGAALAFALWPVVRPADRPARHVEVVLEEDRGAMTESRFIELATEILRADRRYHFAMQEVMDKVIDDEWKPEGVTSEGHSEDPVQDDDEDPGSPFRV